MITATQKTFPPANSRHHLLERSFYEQQCAREKWAVREMQRQIKSSLFLRLTANSPDLLAVIKQGGKV